MFKKIHLTSAALHSGLKLSISKRNCVNKQSGSAGPKENRRRKSDSALSKNTVCKVKVVFTTCRKIGIAVSFRFRVLSICTFRNALHRSLSGETPPDFTLLMPVNFTGWPFKIMYTGFQWILDSTEEKLETRLSLT